MNNVERFLQIKEQYPEVTQRVAAFTDDILNPTVDVLWYHDDRRNALQNTIIALKHAPETVFLKNKLFSEFTPEYRDIHMKYLNNEAERYFPKWFRSNWLNGNKSTTRENILRYSSAHFVQNWNQQLQEGYQPDWSLLQQAHEVFEQGREIPVDPLYVSLYTSIQQSTVEAFLDANTMDEGARRSYLL